VTGRQTDRPTARPTDHANRPVNNRVEDSGGSRESYIRWKPRSPHAKGQFLGKGAPIVKYRDCLP